MIVMINISAIGVIAWVISMDVCYQIFSILAKEIKTSALKNNRMVGSRQLQEKLLDLNLDHDLNLFFHRT